METIIDISGCETKDTIKYMSQSFKEDALTWWKALIQSMGKVALYNLSWPKFVELIHETYYPPHEVEKVESDFLKLAMKNLNCRSYVSNYNSLSRLIPYLITLESKRITRFIGGLATEIKGMVKSSKPATFRSAMDQALSLTEDLKRVRAAKTDGDHKRMRDDTPTRDSNKGKIGSSYYQSKPTEAKPECKTCRKRHVGKCQHNQPKGCGICKQIDNKSLECKDLKNATCYRCGEKGHIKTHCPKWATGAKNKATEVKKGNDRAFQLTAKEVVNDVNVITDVTYEVEMTDGSIEVASTILDGCVISIKNQSIPTYLLPMNLAGFDIGLGMDWLAHNQARITCDKKLIEIKSPSSDILTIRGDQHYGLLEKASLLKASKCLKRGCVIYMAQVTIDEPKPKIEDIPIISKYPDVFPEDLPDLPPDRQVEFRIDILP
ncbi:uncharacterized protein LOC110875451 [Helianthus annuus]|uniref:uncharacterized protein LOC110875451 n=1 Tax=Helianthus annuus TaxID=4232 RepID=UPI000B8F5E22|nr:uncharacterized protein LOC110875451 [Helianthus annuus]